LSMHVYVCVYPGAYMLVFSQSANHRLFCVSLQLIAREGCVDEYCL